MDVAKFFQAYFDRIFIHKLSTFVNKPIHICTHRLTPYKSMS